MQDRYLGRLAQGMDVCDSEGAKIGTVAHVYRYDPIVMSTVGGSGNLPRDELVEVKTGFLGLGRHLFVPMGVIQEVTSGCVFLSKSGDEVKHNEAWQYRPSYLDELH